MLKRFENYIKENKREKIIEYIYTGDINKLLKLLEDKRLNKEEINIILRNIFKILIRVNNKKKIEKLLINCISQGGDINQKDEDGYSVLMNSIFITENAIKAVLIQKPDLYYINDKFIEPADIFKFVKDISIRDKNDKKLKMFYKALQEIEPEIYREQKKKEREKKYNI